MKRKKKPRRVVLGVGHPWFKTNEHSQGMFCGINLYEKDGHSTMPIDIKTGGIGGWNKIRLIAEVIE